MQIAAQLYTVRDFLKTPEDIRKTLKKIKEIGYDSVQLSALGPIDPMLLNEYIGENSLSVCGTHTSFDRIINDTQAVIDEHKLWKCNYIGLGAMGTDFRKNKDTYDEFLKVIRPAYEKIYDAGLQFVYHNHRFEFEKIDGEANGMEYLAKHTEPEKFGFLVDMFWVQAGGGMPVEFLETYKNRIKFVHFKDMSIKNDAIIMAEIGCGNMSYQPIYNKCLEIGVEFAAVEQDDCNGRDPFESLEISLKNINLMK